MPSLESNGRNQVLRAVVALQVASACADDLRKLPNPELRMSLYGIRFDVLHDDHIHDDSASTETDGWISILQHCLELGCPYLACMSKSKSESSDSAKKRTRSLRMQAGVQKLALYPFDGICWQWMAFEAYRFNLSY
jgi:hypothetical protein